jgi:hypothetical protein
VAILLLLQNRVKGWQLYISNKVFSAKYRENNTRFKLRIYISNISYIQAFLARSLKYKMASLKQISAICPSSDRKPQDKHVWNENLSQEPQLIDAFSKSV